MLKIELSVEEVNAVLAGLGKLPLEMSVAVWSKVKTQAEEQLRAQENQTNMVEQPKE